MAVLEIGSGTEEAPYLIRNAQEFQSFWNNPESYWYELTTDIDMDGVNVGSASGSSLYPKLNGQGHSVLNINMTSTSYWMGTGGGQFINIAVYFNAGFSSGFAEAPSNLLIENVRIHWNYPATIFRALLYGYTASTTIRDVLLTGDVASITYLQKSGADVSRVYIDASIPLTNTQGSVAVQDLLDPTEFPTFDPTFWNLAVGTIPALIPQAGDYSGYTHIKGTTLLDGQPYSRKVRAVTADRHEIVAEVDSDLNGDFDVVTSPHKRNIIVYAYDPPGKVMRAATAYALDEILEPAQPNGYRYICIQAGTTADPLPDLPWPIDQLTSGTAIFEARKIRQPMMHGPITPVPIV